MKTSARNYFVVLILCAAASGVVICGAWLGDKHGRAARSGGLQAALSRWDGLHYKAIANSGYTYDPAKPSSVAFFPAYPLLARAVSRLLRIGEVGALVTVSNGCLLAAFAAMGSYLLVRGQAGDLKTGRADKLSSSQSYAMLAMAVTPTTFFFRMAYSESLLLLVSILVLYAIARRWPLLIIALMIGFATAVRPIGVGLFLPLAWHVRTRSATWTQTIWRLIVVVPLACWGLLAYMAFQYHEFGQPLAFAQTQVHWQLRPLGTLGDKLLSLVSWEPIWSVYLPGSWGYWAGYGSPNNAFLDLQFANPIYFLATAALVILGAWRQWLTAEEFLMSAAFLGIPYVTRAYEMCMVSQGRFAAVVFPAYIVAGCILARLPRFVSVFILICSAALMALYAARFGAGYELI